MNGRVITVLGRSGEGKSFFNHSLAAAAWKAGYRVGFFSPEMNRHEHESRLHTLLSADPMIQEACGLKQAFRNRALMEGVGFSVKKYENFCEYLDSLRGRVILFTQENRRHKMTASYIDSKVEDLNLDLVFVDPIYKLRGPRRRDSPVWELSDLIDEIEDMAKGHNIPVVISNQSHRQRGVAAKRRAPSKDTSYMSDALIHESDHVVGVRFDAEEKLLLLKCSKSRFGGEFDIEVKFHPNIGLIKELTEPKGSWLNGGNSDGKDDEPGKDLPALQTADDGE
jgi:replicative DNA helicase